MARERHTKGGVWHVERHGNACEKNRGGAVINIWRHLQTSDHLYFMCNKWLGDGDVHGYFSHYGSIWKAIGNFFTILHDFQKAVGYKIAERGNLK